jgi:hypothetical protein
MLGAELSQRMIMALLGDRNVGAWPASTGSAVKAQPLLIGWAEAGGCRHRAQLRDG